MNYKWYVQGLFKCNEKKRSFSQNIYLIIQIYMFFSDPFEFNTLPTVSVVFCIHEQQTVFTVLFAASTAFTAS